MSAPLTRLRLDQMRCASPGCTHEKHGGLFLHGRCHIGEGNEVEYRDGVLYVRCCVCQRQIVDIQVAVT